jgi:hypothetical protein
MDREIFILLKELPHLQMVSGSRKNKFDDI